MPFGDWPNGAMAMADLHIFAKIHERDHPKVAKATMENSYVENLLQSTPTDQEVALLATDVEDILARGNFNITLPCQFKIKNRLSKVNYHDRRC